MPSSIDFLRSLPYFGTLSTEEIERVRNEVSELSVDKGEILFLEGESCRGLYVVKQGRIRIFKSSQEGREQVLMVAGSGDSFNDVPVFDGGPNPASGSALEPSTVYIVPKETVLSLLANCPPARAIIKVLAARLRHLTMVVENLSFRNVISRLAKMLLELAVAEGGPLPILRLTQDEMAAMVGSVRDVVGRVLRALEKAGAIRLDGQQVRVVDQRKLKEMI